MKVNVAGWDRLARVALAIVFFALNLAGIVTGGWGIALLVVGAVFLVTGLVGFCPLYALLKIHTNKA